MPKLNERPLRVVPNPYAHLDHNGWPAAAFPYDVDYSAKRRLYVGAEIDRSAHVLTEKRGDGDPRSPTREQNRFRFVLEDVEVEDTAHHRMGIRDGSLLPADERTHRSAMGASVKYVPWKDALRAARRQAAEQWKRETGEDAPFLADEKAPLAPVKESQ